MMEQREAARRELERQRQQESEKHKLVELIAQRQREQESVCHLKQKQKNLTFQMQAMQEKSVEIGGQIAQIRAKIVGITNSIEGMKKTRDGKTGDLDRVKRELLDAQSKVAQLLRERQELQNRQMQLGDGTKVSETFRQVLHGMHNHELNMESLRQSLADTEKEIRAKQEAREDQQTQLDSAQNELGILKREKDEFVRAIAGKQVEARTLFESKATEKQQAWASQPSQSRGSREAHDAWGGSAAPASHGFDDNWAAGQHATAAADQSSGDTVRYRAVFEFQARGDDEISFQPGDIIMVFTDHTAQPGWLAGEFQGKVGWFPADYAEPVGGGAEAPAVNGGEAWPAPSSHPMATYAGGTVEVLDGIEERSFEEEHGSKEHAAEYSTVMKKVQSPTGSVGKAKAGFGESGMTSPQHEQVLTAQSLYPWKAKKDDHLAFDKGEVIRILEQQELWWKGELNGKIGWFPKSYVKIITDQQRMPLSRESTEVGSHPPGTPASMGSPVKETVSPPPPATQEGEVFVAIYQFIPAEQGDLGFKVGDRITVISQESDWWTGRVGDREGIFPANYVQKDTGTQLSRQATQEGAAPVLSRQATTVEIRT